MPPPRVHCEQGITRVLLTKVTQQADIKALHGNAGRDQQTPADGLGVEPDTLQQGHRMLLVGGQTSIVGNVVFGFGRGKVVVGDGTDRLIGFRSHDIGYAVVFPPSVCD